MECDNDKISSPPKDVTEAGSTNFETAHKERLSISPPIHTSHDRSSTSPMLEYSTEILNLEDIPPATAQDAQRDNCCHNNRPLLGIILAVLSAVTFSFSALLGKLVSHLNSFNVGLWTFLLMTVFAIILILFHHLRSSAEESIFSVFRTGDNNEGRRTSTKFYLFLLMRAICGVSALLFFFYSVKFIAVGDVIVIDASSPIFVYIMAFIFLGEKFGYLVILTTLLAFSGVTLIARPPLFANKGEGEYNFNSLVGAGLAVSAMLCITISVITLKFLEGVHYSIVNFAFSFWGIVQCTVVTWLMGALSVPTDPWDIFKIVSIAIVFYLGQAFLTQSLKYLDAGAVGLLRTTEVVFIFIWQWIFLGVVPDIYTWCGGALILLGAMLTIFRNWINTLDEVHSLRKKCKCLLW